MIEWTPVIVALITAGFLKALIDGVKWLYKRRAAKRQSASSEGRQSASIATVDQSLAVVARARDELEADNALLRAMLAEERASRAHEIADLTQRHQAERAVWGQEKSSLKAEVADLERRLREMLAEVESIRRRTS